MPINIEKIMGDTQARAAARARKKGDKMPRIIRLPGWKIAEDIGLSRPVIPAVGTDAFWRLIGRK